MFKSYDGKWRYEIDDSKMKFKGVRKSDLHRMSKKLQIENRIEELEEKFRKDTISKAEEKEYYKLDEEHLEYNTFGTLADYIDHPQLFKAYPQLKDVKIGFTTEDVFYGTYSHRGNIITLNFNLPKEEMKSNLIHEIQHAIQEIEGFANGSNVEYWESKGSDNPYGVYRKTAGDIEARDSQKRLEYTAAERKNIHPDIDRTDVVFADGEIGYSQRYIKRKYAKQDGEFYKALNREEWASFYSSLQKDNQRNAFRIGNNGILIFDENNSKNYKLVCYYGDINNPYFIAVYKLKNYDYNINSKQPDITKTITELERVGYNEKQIRTILQNYTSVYRTLFKRYNHKSGRFLKLTRESISNRENVGVESNGTGASENVGSDVSEELNQYDDINYQHRSKFVSNREILANALETTATTGEEISRLRAYKAGVASLNEDAEQLADIKQKIKEISFTKGSDCTQLVKLSNSKKILEDRIVRKDEALLKLESMEAIQNILDVEKKKIVKKLKAKAVAENKKSALRRMLKWR